MTTSGKKIENGNIPELSSCSPCQPTQQELDYCWQTGGNYDWTSCFCGASPIVIDVAGNGFNLTNSNNGIDFDVNGDGLTERVAWSSANSDDAWLALDRNNNGRIDDGKELFGNSTPQPTPPADEEKNGFLALAVFVKPENGGNNDGQIDRRDAIFSQLKLWQDVNHNGISEPAELQSLSSSAVRILELNYRESRRRDEHGNWFKYRATVRDVRGAQIGRWAWDVFLAVRRR